MEKGYPLVDTGITVDDTFVTGAKIYYTHHPKVYLSETFNGVDHRTNNVLCLLNKFGEKKRYQIISEEIVKTDLDFTVELIDKFVLEMGIVSPFKELTDKINLPIRTRIELISELDNKK